MIVIPSQNERTPRLGLREVLAIAGAGVFPRVEGWVQCTKRELLACPRCGSLTSYDMTKLKLVCPACGLDEGLEAGPVTQQVAQHNLITREFYQMLWFENYGNPTNYGECTIFIGNDDTGVHELKGVAETTMNGTANANVTAVKNTVSKYYTYTSTFSAPTSNRVIRQVGLRAMYNAGWYGNAYNSNFRSQIVCSMTKLSSEITQKTSETFEVVYKYQFSEVTP
jgi:hypothetical protein